MDHTDNAIDAPSASLPPESSTPGAQRFTKRLPDTDRFRSPAPRAPRPTSFHLARSTINFWLDAVLALVLLAQLWIGFVLRFAFPPAPEAQGWTIWGWSYVVWFKAQFAVSCTLGALVVLHVMLHWTWVCGVVSRWFRRPGAPHAEKDDPTRTLVGVMLLIGILVVLGSGLAAAVFSAIGPD